MFKTNRILLLIVTFALVFAANAQEKPPAVSTNTNYEAILQLVAASNDSTLKNPLPPNLENISRQIKNDFGYSNYRVVLSSLNRVNNNGSFVEAKGLTSTTTNGTTLPTFYEISFGFGNKQTENEQPTALQNVEGKFNISTLRFGFRVPIPTTLDSTDNTKAVFNYQQIGLTTRGLALTENEPTIIGTLTSSRADELLILIMTVREAKADTRNLAKKR